MKKQKLNIMIIGAHPDDCEIQSGGLAILARRRGHRVLFVSMTNGDTGHHKIGGVELARRRHAEAEKSAALAGAGYACLDIPSNDLEPCLFLRRRLIEMIRQFKTHVVITHRPNDYHPDHRYTSIIVQDTSSAVTVPNVCPLTPGLKRNPLYLYMADTFRKPRPFSADLIFGIDAVVDRKTAMVHAHTSQVYEWLPWERGWAKGMPRGEKARKAWIKKIWMARNRECADRFRNELKAKYGEKKGAAIMYAEAYEICEYGSPGFAGRCQKILSF